MHKFPLADFENQSTPGHVEQINTSIYSQEAHSNLNETSSLSSTAFFDASHITFCYDCLRQFTTDYPLTMESVGRNSSKHRGMDSKTIVTSFLSYVKATA